ncbi:unnamed protein product, partial [Mesorhabditis spiculigera]
MAHRRLALGLALVAIALAQEGQSGEETTSKPDAKRRQYIAGPLRPAVPLAIPRPVMAAPAIPMMPLAQPAVPVAPVGQCPGGPSLPIECDPKRPWPQCPPQSYCYATNSVDIGPYFCCPVWSTYGAAWRPAAPFYNYVPPVPANWPEALRMTAAWPASAVGLPVYAPGAKSKKPAKLPVDGEEKKEEEKMESSINKWMERQSRL